MEAYIVLTIVVLGTLGAGFLTINYRNQSLTNQKKLENKSNEVSELGKTIESQSAKNIELSVELAGKTDDNKELIKENKELGQKNQYLNEELKKLSLRLSDQSKVIRGTNNRRKSLCKIGV
ncbi:hypothetical protein [Tenacibaculum sp. MAR_2010_89]|uniref:hypothetical protein n=1 Tax=Tenacibaculum sp. MAR_2010_89 TaxID=1250198 RepID=UPI00115FB943|nr:hypothetical protein [Tenacibaculum sp. MAR_2010_89]